MAYSAQEQQELNKKLKMGIIKLPVTNQTAYSVKICIQTSKAI